MIESNEGDVSSVLLQREPNKSGKFLSEFSDGFHFGFQVTAAAVRVASSRSVSRTVLTPSLLSSVGGCGIS